MRDWWRELALDLATVVLTPVEWVVVTVVWLVFVGVVNYGTAHAWARRWIIAVYEWGAETFVE